MNISYTYRVTPQIQEFITQIETYNVLSKKLWVKPRVQENLLRRSILKSSLFSARIEGNTLDLSNLETNQGDAEQKKEIFQILEALKFVRSYENTVSAEFICKIHETVMDGLTSELGRFRSEQSAIFNQAGVAIYLPPPPQNVKKLIDHLLINLNQSTSLGDIAISHFTFEKIHPFLDGNGRVGRILMSWQLTKMGFGFGGLMSFEEYLENNREKYYNTLAIPGKDITEFVEFILETIADSAEKLILELQNTQEDKIEDTFLPRRTEILYIIREHQMMSFDLIKRRFLQVSARTLHNDLQYLIKKGLIKKRGVSRGVLYVPK